MDLVREKYWRRVSSLRTEGEAIQENNTGLPRPAARALAVPRNDVIQAFIIYSDQNPIGYIQIYNAYDFPRSKTLSALPANLGAFDIFIGEEAALQQGLGSKAI
ncbi:GNAT family N-acetyltransferase domain protein [Rickettsiales endosymbiont of Paramecium tredecaurelia]|nr:acetyltransferase [Candidatus Sarmatiella mevalonica]MBL3285323.1 GNAT family N-acetyltransferase domain protein [Candidatus Sarmatiella mevalonica]